MKDENENPYQLFNAQILNDWKASGVKYIKLIALESNLSVKFFELIPDSEIPDADETIYPIDSDDVDDLLVPEPKIKFLVHNIYLEEEE